MQSDFRLIIKQVNGKFTLKKITLVSYETGAQKHTGSFSYIQLKHVPRAHKKNVDTLGTLVSKIDILDKETDVMIIKNFASYESGPHLC